MIPFVSRMAYVESWSAEQNPFVAFERERSGSLAEAGEKVCSLLSYCPKGFRIRAPA